MAIKLIVKKTELSGAVSVKEIVLNGEFSTIGNDENSTLFLDDSKISNEQAVILIEENRTILINRADGTFFNESLITKETRCEVTNGDEIQLGDYTVSFLNVNYKPKNSIFIPANTTQTATVDLPVAESSPLIEEEVVHNNGTNGNGLKPTKSFADILSSIRKEEDRFYFQLKSGSNDQKLPIEKDEIILGWDLTGKILSDDPNVVVMPRAVIKKDWSGVMAYPQGKDFVWVNGEIIASPSRLHDGDKLTFLSSFSSAPQNDTSIVFCEPAALVEINSILPQELPSVAPNRTDLNDFKPIESETISDVSVNQKVVEKKIKTNKRKWFGYFSFGEIFLMILVTLAVGVLVFLMLEYW
jgi:pSer/pThr/pTyr-binding forkhead associated (FHA) protein